MRFGGIDDVQGGPATRGFLSTTEWKFVSFLAFACVLSPIFYGLPLLSPLVRAGDESWIRQAKDDMALGDFVVSDPHVDCAIHFQDRRSEQLHRR